MIFTEEGEARWEPLDVMYRGFLEDHPELPNRWLVQQALLTSTDRRSLISSIGIRDGWDVLDVGCGFGTLAVEMAHLNSVDVVGIDIDDEVLAEATRMAAGLSGWINAESSVWFHHDDVTSLSFESEMFDLVTARLLFQHVDRPEAAITELVRVLRHGGRVWIFDVDDAMGISYPAPSAAKQKLDGAFTAWQEATRGDREIGRKLPSYLSAHGLYVTDVRIVSQVQFDANRRDGALRSATVAQYRSLREHFVAAGVIDPLEFDDALDAFESEPSIPQLRIESQVVVSAQKP